MVWNGDYVDRGAWGAEILVLLCALKLRSPRHVFLVRGNHETATCTEVYGFKGELASKYGGRACRDVYAGCRKLFAEMPLAALIAGRTLVLHGGLFRKPPPPAPATRTSGRRAAAKAAAAAAAGGGRTTVRSSDGSALAAGDGDGERSAAASDSVLQVGSLDDLRRGSKGGEDPDPDDPSRVQELAADVLVRRCRYHGCSAAFHLLAGSCLFARSVLRVDEVF